MLEIRRRDRLGVSQRSWLRARHHFSIGEYFDPTRLGWGKIRAWNDDEFAPGHGFPLHPHADMEIITYVRSGAITHEDSLGNRGRTEAGDVQVMSAGTGIRHSEYNLEGEPTRLYQIWIAPDQRGGPPKWGTRPFPKAERSGRRVVLASGFPDDGDDALPISAQARLSGATLFAGKQLSIPLDCAHHAYLVAPEGVIEVNGLVAQAGDGIAIRRERNLDIVAHTGAELVLVETA